MRGISLDEALKLIAGTFAEAAKRRLRPLTAVVLDAGGHVKAALKQDGCSMLRFEIAYGKAWTCVALGHSTRFVEDTMTKNRPHFVDSLAAASHGRFIPALGGVIIRARAGGELIGALGITGDTGENDEAVAIEAIKECGFTPDLS